MKKHKIRRVLLSVTAFAIALILLCGYAVRLTAKAEGAAGLSVKAKSAVLMDYHSGAVVYRQNENEHLPIASMVKIMTLLLVFEEIEKGNMDEATEIAISENAAGMGGSQAFLDAGTQYKAEELIKSIVVASANDSCVALAEHISGDTTTFADRMNMKAEELGLKNTNFVNCTGLPAPNQYSCALDVAAMMRSLISHPIFFKYSTVWMFDFQHSGGRITSLSNTNKLIKAYEGCDGGKTGFTNEAMYCLSATARRGNTRLISVVMGAETSKIRNGENAKLFSYGFANFETRKAVEKGSVLETPRDVINGKEKTVKLIAADDFFYFAKKGDKSGFTLNEVVNPIKAPLTAGAVCGKLEICIDGNKAGEVNLISPQSIDKVNYLDILDGLIESW